MASAILQWDANTETDLKEYKVYRQIGANALVLLATVAKPTVTYTDTPLPAIDGNIVYNLTAVDTSGNESPHSVSVTKTVNLVPPVAPSGLTVVLS